MLELELGSVIQDNQARIAMVGLQLLANAIEQLKGSFS